MSELVALYREQASANGFHVHDDVVPKIAGAGVSRAVYALADTGSVVLAASPDEPRTASLLPSSHVTIVRRDRILGSLQELFEIGDDLPSSLAIVSGPSRSMDIELVLALGVHGPAEVHVVLVDAPA